MNPSSQVSSVPVSLRAARAGGAWRSGAAETRIVAAAATVSDADQAAE